MDRTRLRRVCLLATTLVPFTTAFSAEDPSSVPVAETRLVHTRQLQDQLSSETKSRKERQEAINAELQTIAKKLAELEPQGGVAQTTEERNKADTLISRRTALQNESTFLDAAVNARMQAIDSQETAIQYLQELELFKRRIARSGIYYGPAEVAAIRARLEQAQMILKTIEKLDNGRKERLAEVEKQLDSKDSKVNKDLLRAERTMIMAQIDAARESRESWNAQIKYHETKLSVASPSTAATMKSAVPTSGPAEKKDAEIKQRVAELLESEARGARALAKQELTKVRAEMAEVAKTGRLGASNKDISELENDREYYEDLLNLESRRARQAESTKKIAAERRQIADLYASIDTMTATLADITRTARRMTVEERQSQAEDYRAKAVDTRKQAEEVYKRIEREQPDVGLWAALQQTIDATGDALKERLQREPWIVDHYQRMKTLLDRERQQIDSLQNSWEAIKQAISNEAALTNKLASLYERCANQLDPPGPGFWEKNRKIITSIYLVCVAFAASYGLKLLIWLIQRIVREASARGFGRFSVKRAETLLSFFGGIVRLFIWVFAIILVLNAFDIDPAKTTGVIGLVSLVLAGMFQQIVIDFVKGFDILTGRHYNVGDFVELDGKTGHVIDFSVKHTRIRTASGQEFNLPNSKCVPSRRFPDGYVDNYVDISVRSSGDMQRAKRAIAPVCRHLSRRIEQVKDEPIFVDQFPGPRPGSVILRYRVRVLPGSDWVVTEQFIPDVKAALGEEGIDIGEDPTFFFINRIQTFRQLFSRELSEDEILQEAKEQQRPTVERPESSEESTLPAPKESMSEPVLTG